jgi:D-alanyl-lipoteichoic acid acyltransferase DltB (MBOAT superfamily)
VGISFYTFQALGYSIDVCRGTAKAERNIVNYALFVTFFPQLVAGPIERTGNLLPQFKVNHSFDYDRITSGLRLAAWGMFKKVVIADRIAVYVNGVYGNPSVYPATALLLATFFFTIQIYCDFSGYSDIAIGCARVMGFNLMTNFKKPYFARSITDFWRRWHISLTTWLKDYIYIPLGGNRKGELLQRFNIMVTFLISGLWHGAAWHFVFWGILHGVLQIIERGFGIGTKKDIPKNRPIEMVRICICFLLVSFAWIFFRAGTIGEAFLIIGKIAKLPAEIAGYTGQVSQIGIVATVREMLQMGMDVAYPIGTFGLKACLFSFISIVILLSADIWSNNNSGTIKVKHLPLAARWAGYYALIFTLALNWTMDTPQFIYFTF